MARQSDEFEQAWAAIVADLSADKDSSLPGLASGAGTYLAGEPQSADEIADQDDPGGWSRPVGGAWQPGAGDGPRQPDDQAEPPAGSTPLAPPQVGGHPPQVGAPGADKPGPLPSPEDTWADEGHFVPPPPPDLPTGTPISRLAWAGTLGGPAVFVLLGLTAWNVPSVVPWAAGLATVAGFVTLVWHLPDSRPDDGWDDGAQL